MPTRVLCTCSHAPRAAACRIVCRRKQQTRMQQKKDQVRSSHQRDSVAIAAAVIVISGFSSSFKVAA
jgi:hypothetical protein